MAVGKFSSEEKLRAVKEVIASPAAVNATARRLGLHPQTVHRWIAEYQRGGTEAWKAPRPRRRRGDFDERFKRSAVRRAAKRAKTLSAAADELGISVALLSKWIKQVEKLGEQAFSGERQKRNKARKKDRKREKGPRKHFSKEFKKQAVLAVKASDKVVADVARGLGVPPQLLYEWVQAYEREGETFTERPRRLALVYDEEFRRKAVAMAMDPRNVPARVARELRISKGLLSQWVARYGSKRED